MSLRFRTRVAGIAIVSACGFTAANQPPGGGDDTPVGDAGVDDSVIRDAPPDVPISMGCTTVGTYCTAGGERLRMCANPSAAPIDEICPWRCTDTPTPHCRRLQPAGNAVLPADLLPTAGLPSLELSSVGTYVFDTTNGSFTLNTQSQTLPGGWSFSVRNGVGVWRFTKLMLAGQVRFTGPNAAAFVAIDSITINGTIDLQGNCTARNDHGPGGGDGGDDGRVGGGGSAGGGSGSGNDSSCSGGGGGANGGSGGDGGNDRPGGIAITSTAIAALVGGGGGGGGGGGMGGDGGGGGGALQLVANNKVAINGFFVGGIDAGGCGGKTGGSCGGGGGAGGTVVIEAVTIEVMNATLAVNGGGGGGGKSGTSGQAGQFSATRASGGAGGTSGSGSNGGSGGDGGDDGVLDGEDGFDATRAGGGGGGVGRMRFHTLGGTVMLQQVLLSPRLSTSQNPSPVVQAKAALE